MRDSRVCTVRLSCFEDIADSHREAGLSPQEERKLKNMRPINLNEACSRISDACTGTLQHLRDDEIFINWQDSSKSSALCIHAPPGQGKSVLAKYLAKNLPFWSMNLHRVPPKIISFFCREQQDGPADVLRSLIYQLIDCHELFECVPDRYHKHSREFFDASLSDLWDIFKTLILTPPFRSVYCVIDALEECEQSGSLRADFLHGLIIFVKECATKGSVLKLLVTSRPGERDLESHYQGVPGMTLRVRTEELDRYIETRVTQLDTDSFSKQIKDHIQEKVKAGAQGTYLWASIVIEEISKLQAPSMDEVDEVLKESPKDLNELYRKLVGRLRGTPIFAKILIWVAYSAR